MGDLGAAGRTVLPAHPLKSAPNCVYKAVLRMAEKAPHRLVLAPSVLQAHKRPAALRRTPRRLSARFTTPAGSEARPVAAGALLALVTGALNQLWGPLRRTR